MTPESHLFLAVEPFRPCEVFVKERWNNEIYLTRGKNSKKRATEIGTGGDKKGMIATCRADGRDDISAKITSRDHFN
jgi:hypothetical protein